MGVEIPKSVSVWKLGAIKGNLRSTNNYQHDKGYSLYCSPKKKYLIWKSQPLGINLDWSTQGQNKYHFHLPDKKEREILTGEPFALAIGGGEPYLKYAHRTQGINLKWSAEPAYEWVIYGPKGEKGKPIPTNALVAILNKKVEPDPDFLIYFDRPMPGVADVGWTSSPGFWDSLLSLGETVYNPKKWYEAVRDL